MKNKSFQFPFWMISVAVYMAMCALLSARIGGTVPKGLIWNLILAMLPLLFVRIASCVKNLAAKLGLLALWLLFLPNAFYMITDLIHVPSKMGWIELVEGVGEVSAHSQNVNEWLMLIVIGVGAILAYWLGLQALYLFFVLIKKPCGAVWGHIGVLVTCGLCAMGIYIGRFMRVNSWEILNPIALIKKFVSELNWFSVEVMLWFAVPIILLFYFYISFNKSKLD